MMGGSMYPEKTLWYGRSHITGTVGTDVDMTNYVGRAGSFVVNVPPALAAAVTVSFETAAPLATNACLPDPATWTAMQSGGLDPLGGGVAFPLALVITPADTDYSITKGKVCRVSIECRSAFVRAKLSVATAGVTVDVIGKAARLSSIA